MDEISALRLYYRHRLMTRGILLGIGLILSILLILGFIAPKRYDLVHVQQIAAPKSDVYPFLNTLQMMHQWSGIVPQSDEVIFTYGGTAGTVGSEVHWEHQGKAQEGRETITKVIPLDRIETDIRYIRPWESLNSSVFTMTGEGDTTVIQWNFHGHSPFPFNIRHLFVDMAARLGPRHEAALDRLRRLSEVEHLEQHLKIQRDTSKDQLLLSIDTMQAVDSFSGVLSRQLNSLPDSIHMDSTNEKTFFALPLFVDGGQDQYSLNLCLPLGAQIPGMQLTTLSRTPRITAWHEGGYHALTDKTVQFQHYLSLLDERAEPETIAYEFVRFKGMEEDSTKWLTAIHAKAKAAKKR